MLQFRFFLMFIVRFRVLCMLVVVVVVVVVLDIFISRFLLFGFSKEKYISIQITFKVKRKKNKQINKNGLVAGARLADTLFTVQTTQTRKASKFEIEAFLTDRQPDDIDMIR